MSRDARQPPDVARPTPPYSPVVVADPLVFTAGQVAMRPDGTLVDGGIEEQTRQVLDNVERCLAASQGFVKFGAGACEVFSLLGSHGADFAPATGVDGVKLGGDNCGWEC